MDAVLSAASLEEALARFELQEQQQQQQAQRENSPQGGAFGSSNGTSSCRSWDKGDSDYVSMDDVQSSLHHSPEGGMSGGEDLPEHWTRFLTVDYAPERLGPAEEEIWSGIEHRAQDRDNDHPVSDWVSNLMPSNRYHPRVLSPGIHPMTSIREESEDRSAPASPTSPVPSPFKLLETQRSLQTSPFLSVTSPSPDRGEEQFDSFEWRPQIMASDQEEQVVVGSLIDFDNTAALKADVHSSNQSLCEENTSPQRDLLDFLLTSSEDTSKEANAIDETLNEDVAVETPEENALQCIDEAIETGQQGINPSEGNNSKIGDIDIEAWNNAIDEYLAPSSLDSWESIRHPEHFSTPTCEDAVLPDDTTKHNVPLTDDILPDDSEYPDSPSQDPSVTNESTDFTSSVASVSEERQETNDQQCEKSCCSREVLSFLTNNQPSSTITVPQILIEDIDLILTPCVSPQLFEELDNEQEKNIESSRTNLSQGDRLKCSPKRVPPSTLQDDPITSTSELEPNIKVCTKVKPEAVPQEKSDNIEKDKQLNFDSPTSESGERNNFSDFIAKSQRLESKFRDAAKENCSISQWPVDSSADIVPLPIRVTQWKQFWDQKAQKKKEDFKTSGVQRTIKRGSTHLEYLKCCHSNNNGASPQRKRQHPSIRIPGIVSKWRKSFESVVDANKVAREFMKLRGVKKRKSILPSYNVDQEQIIYVDDAKSNTIPPEATVPEKDYPVKPPSPIPLKIEKEWPESNLVTNRKKKFEIGEPISQQRRTEYFKTIPPRNKVPKVAEYRKFWDNLSKGQSCGDLNREIGTSGLMITEEIIIDLVPTSDVNKTTVISESKTNETKSRKIPCDLDSRAEQKCLKEKSTSVSDPHSIHASPARKSNPTSPTSRFKLSRLDDTIKLFENVSRPLSPIGSAETPSCQPPESDKTESLNVQPPPVEAAKETSSPSAPEPRPTRRLHIVSPEEMWYKARRIPIEEVEGLSSGSDEPSRSLDESDQSWSIVEEGAESQPDSLTDTCSLSSHRARAPPPPPTLPAPSTAGRAAANRSNRQARSRFENAKLFFQSLESGGRGVGMGVGSTGMPRRRGRLRGGTDLDTSTDDTGSEGGGTVRLPRSRRRCGGGGVGGRGAGGGGGTQSDTETLLLLSRERVRVPRGLFNDVRRGGVPQSRELLAALAAVDSRPASPYEEVAAAAGGEDVTLVPSPSPPASPAPRSPLPHAYDQEYPYLPATDPRHFRPRSTLKSFGLGGVHVPSAFQDL